MHFVIRVNLQVKPFFSPFNMAGFQSESTLYSTVHYVSLRNLTDILHTSVGGCTYSCMHIYTVQIPYQAVSIDTVCTQPLLFLASTQLTSNSPLKAFFLFSWPDEELAVRSVNMSHLVNIISRVPYSVKRVQVSKLTPVSGRNAA